jgi:glutamate N-acetyltransferase/amino-acid N-acetyltransferase
VRMERGGDGIQQIREGNAASPRGFQASGVAAGIKKNGRPDVALLYSAVPAAAAGVFTLNRVKAAPVVVTQSALERSGILQAVVVNAGNANACTGEQGIADALAMRKKTADLLAVPEEFVGVASTGVIGVRLPMENVERGITRAVGALKEQSGDDFTDAIMTTDTRRKQLAVAVQVDGRTVIVGGAAKGSGMIHPNMATMLGFLTTDAAVEAASLRSALQEVTGRTFNMVSVDGDTSTNDLVLCMANGMAGNTPLSPAHPDWNIFFGALELVARELAKQIARDGEGATKRIEVHVSGGVTESSAAAVAKAVARSSLVKTAVHGADANWGRILCAVGYSGEPVDPDMVDIDLGEIAVARQGMGVSFDEDAARAYLSGEVVQIRIHLHLGPGEAVAYGCDLSAEYVRINADYRT